jgi:hypothetical protein
MASSTTIGNSTQPLEPDDSSSPTTAATKQEQTGIDIQKALDILACRSSSSSHDHDHEHRHEHSTLSSSSGCHSHPTANELLKSMGQTIDLTQTTQTMSGLPENASAQDEEDEGKRKQEEDQRQQKEQRAQQLLVELKSMSIKELLQTVFETQQQRVVTYQGYNE